MSGTNRKKVSTTIYMEPVQEEQLRALSNETGVPVAVYIRRCIDRILKENRHLIPVKESVNESAGA